MNHYEILGIEFTATDKEIRKAVREKSLLYHPDKVGDDQKAAELFHQIQIAKETLLDPVLKPTYDSKIKAEQLRDLRFKEMNQQRQQEKVNLEKREEEARKRKYEEMNEKEQMQIKKQQLREKNLQRTLAMKQQKQQERIKIQPVSTDDLSIIVKFKDTDSIALRNYFSKYGEISELIYKPKSAIIIFKEIKSVSAAIKSKDFSVKPLTGRYMGVHFSSEGKGKEYEEITLNKLK